LGPDLDRFACVSGAPFAPRTRLMINCAASSSTASSALPIAVNVVAHVPNSVLASKSNEIVSAM
jgi:hypothetical protein